MRESVSTSKEQLTLIRFTKTSRIYTGARMNNSRSNVYRGDFCKSVKACEFTHVGVFMRDAARRESARRVRRYQAGNAGAYDLVCMPAMRDLGSLQRALTGIRKIQCNGIT
jgi:hypothetical protein